MKNYRFVSLLCLLLMACSDACYTRTVTGKITSVGSRIKGEMSESIALQLDPYFSDSLVEKTAKGEDGLAVECDSTRCSMLKVGQCVELICSFSNRWTEPNVIECKLVNTIKCKE